MGAVMLAFAVVSWPLAAFWFAKDEPPFVVALSELALIYTAVSSIQTALVNRKVTDNGTS